MTIENVQGEGKKQERRRERTREEELEEADERITQKEIEIGRREKEMKGAVVRFKDNMDKAWKG